MKVQVFVRWEEMNRTKLIFWTDTAIFCAFLIAAGIGFSFAFSSGIPGASWKAIHLSSGIVVFAGVIFHLVLHRQWIGAAAKRLIKKASWRTRINFGVNFLLGWVFVLICLSGLNMSLSHAGCSTLFQIRLSIWETMHRGTGTAMTIYLFIHLVLHYPWIRCTAGKIFHYRTGRTQSLGLPGVADDPTKGTLVK
jgi:cytochrome b561